MTTSGINLAPLQTEMVIDISDMTKSLTKIKKDSNSTVEDITKEFGKMENVSNDLSAASKDMSKDMSKSLNNIANDTNSAAVDVSKDFDKLENAEDDLSQNGKKTESVFKKIFNEIKKGASNMGDDVKNSFEKVGKAGESVSNAGGKMTKGVTVPIMAVGAAAFKSAVDVESASSKMQAAMGLTEAEAESLEDVAVRVWENGWGESLDAVSLAIVNVSQQLKGITGDELQQATEKALMLEQVFNMDMSETLRGVNALMQAYGISSEKAFDYITVGAQNGLNKTDELGDNLSEYAPLFEESGYSADEMFNVLQRGLNAGAYNLDKVNDLVKEFGIRISDGNVKKAVTDLGGGFEKIFAEWEKGGGTSKELFQSLTKEIAGLETEQEKAAAISAIFGSQGEDAGIKVVEAMGGVTNAYRDVSGAADEAGKAASDNLGTEFQSLLRETAQALAPIGEELLKVARDILPGLIEKVKGIADVIASLPPELLENIIVLGGALAAIGPILMMLGSVITTVSTAGMALSTVAGAIGVSIGAIMWPITLVIAGLVAFGVAIATNFAGIRDTIGQLLDSVMALVQIFINSFMAFWNSWGGLITQTVRYAFEFIAAFIKGVLGVISGFVKIFSGVLTGDWNKIWEGVKQILSSVGNALKTMFNSILRGLLNLLIGIGVKLWNAAKNSFQKIIDGAKEKWNSLTSWFEKAKEDPVTAILSIGKSMLEAGSDIVNSILDGAKSAWEGVQAWFDDSVQWIKDTVKFWDDESEKVEKKKSKASKGKKAKKDGSHFNGLSYVPFDGYNARLHKGERVLTAEENKGYTQGQVANSDSVETNVGRPVYLQVDGRTFAELFGDFFDDANGNRVNLTERGLV
ncbi:phage tail tape measure protein [Listeria seeligeri]|uniref:phage tail tape measure protein n=1 Tax=Listeria seeligeri TaxID=1640 RepID=UPI0001C4EC4B|nr:phage tail tape measure protein [Listeria seeligeri]CBH27751.1 phage-related minor tail protein, putative [Listeria seeligeri serovar 1/2b str. SLCC3954]